MSGRSVRSCRVARSVGLAASAALGMTAVVSPAWADIWDNSSGNASWSTATNWADNTEPTLSDAVNFPTPVPNIDQTIFLNANEVCSSLLFSDNYLFTDATLQTGSLGLNTGAIAVASGKLGEIDVILASVTGLTKSSPGTLVLTNANNSYSGGISVTGGTLSVTSDGALGNNSNNISVSSGSTLQGGGTFATSRTITIGSGGGTIKASSGKTFTINSALAGNANALTLGGPGTTVLVSASTRTGTTLVNGGGTVVLNDAQSLGSGALTIDGNATLQLAGINQTMAVALNSGGIRGTGNATYSGTITAGSAAATFAFSTGTSAGDVLTVGDANNDYTGGGTNVTTVSGSGVVNFPFANFNYTGTWELDSGTLRIAHPQSLGSLSTPINFLGGTFELNNTSYGNNITIPDTGTVRGTGNATFAGAMTVASGPIVATLASGTSATDVLTVGDGLHHLTGGAGATLHIAGAGVVEMPFGNPGYTGDFVVDSGTLRVDIGTATSGGTSPIVVNNGAAIEINNVNWGRDLTMNSGSTLRGNGSAFYSSTLTVASGASVTLATTAGSSLSNSVVGSTIAGGSGGATIHVNAPTGGSVSLSQPATYAGGWSIDDGFLNVSNANALGTGTSAVQVVGVNAGLALNGITLARSVSVAGQLGSSSSSATLSGNVSLSATQPLLFAGTGTSLTISGNITAAGSNGFLKTDPGTLILTGNNTIGGNAKLFQGSISQTAGTTSVGGTLSISQVTSAQTQTYALSGTAELDTFQDRIGDGGSTAAFVQTGGTHNVSGGLNPMQIAAGAGSVGTYTLSGGTLNVFNNAVGANGEAVGFNGTGTFTQTGGSHNVIGTNGNMVIGFSPTGVGNYTITNGNLTAHSLYLGRDGGAQGTLTVNAGSNVTVDQEFIDIALNAPASATVTVNGGLVDCYGMFVGGKSTVGGGAGVLNVTGGTVIVSPLTGLTNSGQLRVWDTTGTSINLSGGAIACDTLLTSGNPSRFNWTGGELQITGAGGFTASSSGPLGASVTLGNNMTLWIDDTTTIAAGGSIAVTGTGAFTTGSLAGSGALSSDGSFMFTGLDNTSTTYTGSITGVGGLSKIGTGKLTIKNTRISKLAIHGGGTLAVQPTGGASTGTSTVSAITIDGGSKLDLGDNKLVGTFLASGSTWNGTHYTGVAGLIETGYHGGDFLGSGIVTTQSAATGGNTLTGIGFASAAQAGYAGGNFGGIGVGSNDLLVMYTYGGDANLDGAITGDDYFQIDSGFPAGAHGWFNGDFNYDGAITGDDYFIIDSNFPAQGAPFPTSGGLGGVIAVPEPASCCALSLASAALAARRRRPRR